MDASTPDTLASLLGSRSTRRSAVAAGGAGLAAAALGVAGLGRSGAAQEGTAVASEDETGEDRTYFLFVQTFHGGSLTPKEGEEDVYLLTLTGHAAQTIYFSDRPERIVGAVPTVEFLDGLGFTPTNPPNAALVAQTDAGEDVVVLELFNPVYTESFGEEGATTLTYEVKILAEYDEAGLAHLATKQTGAELPEQFGAASLFIDDCPDITDCVTVGSILDPRTTTIGSIPGGPFGRCWNWSDIRCDPCSHPESYFDDLCNQTYAACNGQCHPN